MERRSRNTIIIIIITIVVIINIIIIMAVIRTSWLMFQARGHAMHNLHCLGHLAGGNRDGCPGTLSLSVGFLAVIVGFDVVWGNWGQSL